MLTIRMQRTGRKGFATFRVVVQDSRFSPSSGRVVARIGHYNPHTKETVIDKELAEKYLANGAQPSPRVTRLLKAEKVKLPNWVELPSNDKKRSTKNTDKLRKHQPAEPETEEAPVESEAEIAEEIKEEIEEIKEEIQDEIIAEEIAEVIVAEEKISEEESAEPATSDEKPAEA